MTVYEAKIYYSGYVSVLVKGDNEADAIEKARDKANIMISEADFPLDLQPWKEADEVEEIED